MNKKLYNNKITIRGLEVSPPVAVAPMVGLSHSAFRTLVQEQGGVGLLFSEMLAAGRLPHDNPTCSPLLVRSPGEYPLFYQLVTGDEKSIGPAIDKLHSLDAQGVDLNLGCPAPFQKKQGAGLALSTNDKQMRKILHRMRACTTLPMSVKIRLGDKLDGSKLKTVCRMLEDEGVDLITIHARLNNEKFCRKPRWEVVGEVSNTISLPILINGGIFSVDDARASLEQSGADGIMIGRGAVHNPWLCADIARDIYGVQIHSQQYSREETYFRFIELLQQRFAQERRLGRLKQFTTYFAAPLIFGHHLAAAVQSSESIEQARQKALDFFIQTSNSHHTTEATHDRSH